ncbi:MAG: F0F1 ATP synthase subunit B [Nitrospirae bacterium]|nr:F0F1 ATP synthase subunit B [Nitrospirota bacterium]
MLEFNKWFFVQLINFLVLLVILNRLLFKPLLRIFKERDDKIKNALDSAKGMEKEKEDLLQHINVRLSETRGKARGVLDDLKRQGIAVQKDMTAVAQKEASDMSALAQEKLAAELKSAKEALHKEVEDISNRIVEKLVKA